MFALWQKPAYRIVILTALSFAVFLTSIARQNRVGPVPALVLNSLSAAQESFAETVSWVSSLGSRYLFLIGVKERLDKVESERDYLLSERTQLIELARENGRLRELVGLREVLGGDLLPARIVGIADEKSTLIIDRGTFAGVEQGQAVVAPGGVIGQIWYTGEFTATVLLVSDPRSHVPVFNSRTRARGIAVGGGYGTEMDITRVRRTEDVKAGDLLISAGSGLIFPRGLPVAKISSVGDPGNELTLPVKAVPAADVNILDEVMVVRARGDSQTDSAAPAPPATQAANPDSSPASSPAAATAEGAAVSAPPGPGAAQGVHP